MNMPIVLLFANTYSMSDERTGEINSGTTISYYFNTDMAPSLNQDGSKGMRPAKCSCDIGVFKKIEKAPAIYDAEFEMKIGGDMKPVLKILDLNFLDEIRCLPLSSLPDYALPENNKK